MAQSKCKWLDAKQKQRPIRINVCESPTLRAWTHDWLRVQTRRCIKILVGWTAETATKEIYGNIIHNAPPPFQSPNLDFFMTLLVASWSNSPSCTIFSSLFSGSSPDPKTFQDIPRHPKWATCSQALMALFTTMPSISFARSACWSSCNATRQDEPHPAGTKMATW